MITTPQLMNERGEPIESLAVAGTPSGPLVDVVFNY